MKIQRNTWGGGGARKETSMLEIFKEVGIQNLLTQLEEK
jgi:hypothetical protein